jgi:hypothetical protein
VKGTYLRHLVDSKYHILNFPGTQFFSWVPLPRATIFMVPPERVQIGWSCKFKPANSFQGKHQNALDACWSINAVRQKFVRFVRFIWDKKLKDDIEICHIDILPKDLPSDSPRSFWENSQWRYFNQHFFLAFSLTVRSSLSNLRWVSLAWDQLSDERHLGDWELICTPTGICKPNHWLQLVNSTEILLTLRRQFPILVWD